ncbi:MAG: hypothetical protein KAJ51_02495, partial [Thermoplasmata archaeon]|nr:hypothetical protein [Thermoplasmata archaeon]
MKNKNKLAQEVELKSRKNRSIESGIFNRRLLIIIIFAFYFAFILVSRIPIIAQDSYMDKMQDSYT